MAAARVDQGQFAAAALKLGKDTYQLAVGDMAAHGELHHLGDAQARE